MNFYKDIECAIFDLDGTLIKSDEAWRHVDELFMAKRGLLIPDDFYDKVSTMNLSQAAEYVISECGVADSKESVIQEWLAMVRHEYASVIPMIGGAKEFLQCLKKSGVKIALATASSPELYLPCLKRHGVLTLFDGFSTTSEINRKKGCPDIYLHAANKVGARAEKCAVFEDIYLGCVGAKAAKMYCVGVLEEHGSGDAGKFLSVCDMVIKNFYDIL